MRQRTIIEASGFNLIPIIHATNRGYTEVMGSNLLGEGMVIRSSFTAEICN
ncbi:MAG: hypothetical protein J6V30_00535 [Paludibacteraceae bacterium]|nr:hypothetical protein [Paludibacteraceae bacterium]